MQNFDLRMKRIKTGLISIACVSLSGCEGMNFPSLQTMLINLSSNYPALWQLTTATAYLFGITFILRAVYKLKVYGDMRTMMSSQSDLKSTLMLIVVGSVLLYVPTAFQSVLLSTFGTDTITPLSYTSNNPAWSQQATDALLGLMQLIGLISFIRGWIYLTHSGNPGSQHSFGKALTHIIGGVLAINIQGTINVVQGTFGVS